MIPGLDATERQLQHEFRPFLMHVQNLAAFDACSGAEFLPLFWTLYLAEVNRVRGLHKQEQEILMLHSVHLGDVTQFCGRRTI